MKFKYEKCDLVKVIGSNAVGCVMGRFTSPDLISKKMYIVKFGNNCVEGTFRESQLAKLENKYTFKNPTDYIGHVFYCPKQLDKERMNVKFGNKLLCIAASYSSLTPNNPINLTVVDVDANNWRNSAFEINAKHLCWVDDPDGKATHDLFLKKFKKNIINGVDPDKIIPKFKEGQKVILHKILDDSYVTKFVRDIHVAADGRVYYLLTDLKNLENDTWENEINIEAYKERENKMSTNDREFDKLELPKFKLGQLAIINDPLQPDINGQICSIVSISENSVFDYCYHVKLAYSLDDNDKYYTIPEKCLSSLDEDADNDKENKEEECNNMNDIAEPYDTDYDEYDVEEKLTNESNEYKATKDLVNSCKIENAKITSVDLQMTDHCCFVLSIVVEGEGGGCVINSPSLGYTLLCDGWEYGTEYIMRIMKTIGVDKLSDMVGSYVRVAYKDRLFKAIGNIIKDKWFSPDIFCQCKSNTNKEE